MLKREIKLVQGNIFIGSHNQIYAIDKCINIFYSITSKMRPKHSNNKVVSLSNSIICELMKDGMKIGRGRLVRFNCIYVIHASKQFSAIT